jgi:peptidoglycan/LPS O-acetylase OafA/YrhL
MSEIDWKSELRKVEREYSGLPPEPTAEELREWRLSEEREQRRRNEVNGAVAAWTRLFLVVALAAALYFWPYAKSCGAGLYAYLGAEAAVILGGMWVASYAWRRRTPWAHVAAVVMLLGGVALVAAEVLPRIGYANPDPTRPAYWACG